MQTGVRAGSTYIVPEWPVFHNGHELVIEFFGALVDRVRVELGEIKCQIASESHSKVLIQAPTLARVDLAAGNRE